MRYCRCLRALGLAVLLCVSWTSCETVNQDGNTINPNPSNKNNKGAINTTGFLVTKDPRLGGWLDGRFEVKYLSMTPQLIFDQVPLNEIKYETTNLPVDALPFNFQSKSISRRELLKKIANFWHLDMSLIIGADGVPRAVKVSG